MNLKKSTLLGILSISFMLTLCGCSMMHSKAEKKDGAPKNPKSVKHIPNAKPKYEPLSRYGNPPSYVVFGKTYHTMKSSDGYKQKGVASWYGTKFHGRRTSSGEPYDLYAMTAAHKSLPLPTYVRVKNLSNGKSVIVKVNDRGPFVGDRIIDLSYAAAKKLGVYETGTAKVEVEAINLKHMKLAQAPVQDIATPTLSKPVYLQLGAFQEPSNASKLANQLDSLAKAHQLSVKVQRTEGYNPWYKVRMGPIHSNLLVDKVKNELLAANLPNPTLIFD